jgi:hypothetical protein
MRCTAGYSFTDHRRSEDILEELTMDPTEINFCPIRR